MGKGDHDPINSSDSPVFSLNFLLCQSTCDILDRSVAFLQCEYENGFVGETGLKIACYRRRSFSRPLSSLKLSSGVSYSE